MIVAGLGRFSVGRACAGPDCTGCVDPCTIITVNPFADLDDFTQIGTVSIVSGAAVLQTGEGLVTVDEPTNYYDPVILTVTSSTADSSGTLRLAVARLDADNYLFGEYSFAGSAGTLRLGQRVATVESWLTDAVTVEDTADLGDETDFSLCWVPGEVQDGETGLEIYAYPLAFTDTNSWTAPDDSTGADDNTYATSSVTTGTFGEAWTNFAISLPPGSVITGIIVNIIGLGTENSGAFTPTVDSVTLRDGTGATVGDDKGGGESLPNAHGTLTYGGTADDWNAGLTFEDVGSPSFGVAVDFTTDSNEVKIDTIEVRIFYSTPDRQPGRLTFSRNNVTAATVDCARDYDAEAPGTGKAAAVLSVLGQWDVSALSYKYHQSDALPSCPSCECTVTTISCSCCDEGTPAPGELVVDFGAGWAQAGSGCALCDTVDGEVALPAIGPCLWAMVQQFIDGTVRCQLWIELVLVPAGGGQCLFRLYVHVARYVSASLNELSFAWYESAPIDTDECQTYPVTLDKLIENDTGGANDCSGTLPATITVDIP